MKVFLAKVFYTRKVKYIKSTEGEVTTIQASTRDFIVTGEDEYEVKKKMYHLLSDFQYDDLKVVEICTPFEIV